MAAGGSRADEAMPAEKSAALAAHERLRRAKAGLEAVAGRPRRPAPDAPRIDAVAELLMACSCAPDAVGEPGDACEEFLELEASESPGPVAARRAWSPWVDVFQDARSVEDIRVAPRKYPAMGAPDARERCGLSHARTSPAPLAVPTACHPDPEMRLPKRAPELSGLLLVFGTSFLVNHVPQIIRKMP